MSSESNNKNNKKESNMLGTNRWLCVSLSPEKQDYARI